MYIYFCTGVAGVQESAEEVEAAGVAAVEGQEEAGAVVVVEEGGLAEGGEHLLAAQALQRVIRGDRHA